MDMFSDNFISYNNDFDVKLEKSSDHDISLESSSLGTCDTTPCLFPSPFSPSLQNLLNSHEGLTLNDNQFDFKRRNKKPFIIIKTKYGEANNNDFEVKVESEDKLLNKSKLIMKREKAKQRAKSKLDAPILTKLESNVCLEDIDTSEADPKTKKKIIQMIRNRISAQNSRDRKKAYLNKLEDSKNQLYAETMKASQEKSFLMNEILRVKEQNLKLSQENQKLRSLGCEGGFVEGGHFCPTDSEIKNQSVEELAQQIIRKSDPATSELLSKNKGLFKNTFSFALSLSIILLAKMGQGNLAGNSEVSLEKMLHQLRGEHFLEDSNFNKEGSYLNTANNQTPSHIEVEESMNQSENSEDYSGKQSLMNFNTIFQHLVEVSKMNEPSSHMMEEYEERDFLQKSMKQEDRELKPHQYSHQFLISRNGNLGLQTNNFLNLNLDEGEDKYSLKF